MSVLFGKKCESRAEERTSEVVLAGVDIEGVKRCLCVTSEVGRIEGGGRRGPVEEEIEGNQ